MHVEQQIHRLSFDELEAICGDALRAVGANAGTVASLTRATLDAEARQQSSVGAAHLIDYLESLKAGRINADAQPRLQTQRAGVSTVDADEGVAQLAFDASFDGLVKQAKNAGVAVLSISNSYSGGALSYYVARLAEAGLVAFAAGSSAALMSVMGSKGPITGTNPHAFALPHPKGPRLFDQASSATAWVNIRQAGQAGTKLPEGWVVDADGHPTTDPQEALAGSVLPFGGVKGANIAMMIGLLSTLSGGAFAIDAAPFDQGERNQRIGLFILALDPEAFDPEFVERSEAHLVRLNDEYGVDFGRRKAIPDVVELSGDTYQALVKTKKEQR